ncbi:uncharacterized protein TrAtP1_002283 [Trichoderma atroviride]|uniref:uncharacterized protein n=1 Tax=Hypocrea atroviridis TaxID=63577 RepID=UPI00331AA8D9|nr:hypothetical protein TrAtP1_002283 [Trichoderma atroviride]
MQRAITLSEEMHIGWSAGGLLRPPPVASARDYRYMEPPTNYGPGNRAFLQALLARGTLTYPEARPIIAAIINADNAKDSNSEEHRPDQISEDIFLEYIDKASGGRRGVY